MAVGEPIYPTLPPIELTALLHSRMQHLLERCRTTTGRIRPASSGCRTGSGGGAPTLAEANRMDAEEAAGEGGRAARRAGSRYGAPG